MSGDRGIDYYFNILGDYTLRNGIRLDSVPKKILEEIPEGSNVIFKGGKLKRTVFEGINFNRNLTIEFSDCEIDRELQFQVENCVFIFRDMKRSNVDFHIEVISKTVSSRLSIDNSRFETIILNNSKLVEFTISNTICRNLVVNESFINFFSCKDLNLRIIDTQSIFRVKLSKILNLEINEVKNLNKIKFESLESEKVELFNSNIESIEFVDYNVCSLNITNGSIDDIQITVEEFKEEKQDEEGNITSPKVIRKEFSLIGLMPTYLGKIHIKDNANNYFFAINLSGDKIILRNINTFYLTINGDIKEKSRISNCEIENLELNNFEAVNGVKFNNVNNSILAGCFMMRDSSLTNVALNPSIILPKIETRG
ncbi:hypothetical protein [Cyclobacterium xiamenense]|uniref:hypothetical protein n=1 Tax=Cyclobacterium xiamenense TaxID=1297121 RepID=UPI0012B8BBBA|nr:hypothetical protein [Cyclobacterium xiamenense]